MAERVNSDGEIIPGGGQTNAGNSLDRGTKKKPAKVSKPPAGIDYAQAYRNAKTAPIDPKTGKRMTEAEYVASKTKTPTSASGVGAMLNKTGADMVKR